MFSLLLQDTEVTKKVLEAVFDSPNGKRTLSRLARTCREVAEPALNILWRELDSFAPLIGLFPNHLLKKTRKPGVGLAKAPIEEDWKNVLKYSEKVRCITYDESSNAVTASVFRHLDECRPRIHILPNLVELHWKAETPAGLDRCAMFLGPEIRVINIEIGTRFPQLNHFLSDVASRTTLTSFSFISPTTLPATFTDLLANQLNLESVTLVAPGALSSGIGRWTGSLPGLKSLQLDLSGRSAIIAEGFFDELRARSGDSTPSSVGRTDSGVFSDEDSDDDFDFSLHRKSALRLKGDLTTRGFFTQLRRIHLTGSAATLAEFLRHISSPLTQLELVVEDPPENADWQDLSAIICERFGESLQFLRITGMSASRLYGSAYQPESSSSRLSLEHFRSLPHLTRLEIDLPETPIFVDADIENISKSCPNLEVLRLCPLSRFPTSGKPPRLTLDSLATLFRNCRHLHTLAIVLNAKKGSAEVLSSRSVSSQSLLRLHVGNSWIKDPLQASILLSHLAPYLETLKWFSEKNRPGYNDAHARGWQSVSETLPHLQRVRLIERETSSMSSKIPRRLLIDRGIDATPKTISRGISAVPRTTDTGIQSTPALVNRSVEATPTVRSASIDATPSIRHVSVHAYTTTVDQGVDARPPENPIITQNHVESETSNEETKKAITQGRVLPPLTLLPTLLSIISWAWNIFISNIRLPIPYFDLRLILGRLRTRQTTGSVVNTIVANSQPLAPIVPPSVTGRPNVAAVSTPEPPENIPLEPLEVRQ